MKKIVMMSFLTHCFFNSSAQIVDNFNDSNFNSNPLWYGDTSKFSFSSGKLKSNSLIANDKFYISSQSKLVANSTWSFFINLQFNTSSLNYVDVFLTSDSLSLTGQNSGYFVRLGGTYDEICLYKKIKNTSTLIIDGRNGTLNHSNNFFKVKVICDSNFNFTLCSDSTGTGNNYKVEGSVLNNELKTSDYAGIVIKQSTASFFKLHFFDDFEISKIFKDTINPVVNEVQNFSFDTLRVSFSEKMNNTATDTSNYDLNNSIGKPSSVRFISIDSTIVELIFTKKMLPNIFYKLSIKSCEDKSGLKLTDTIFSIIKYKFEIPELYDVLITEIMADPEPQIGLPNAEYIELYNKSAKIITLKNCIIHDQNSFSVLPDIQIYPDSFIIFCEKSNLSLFSKYKNAIGLTYFPSLNNSGDEITLRNNEGKLVHRLIYSTKSYNDNLKSNGGWALEMIDISNPCNETNFKASVNPEGGTPGKTNSVKAFNPDFTKPYIIDFYVKNNLKVVITMSEIVDSFSAFDIYNYNLNINTIEQIFVNQNKIEILLKNNLKSPENYNLTIKKIHDCSMNFLRDTSINFTLPELPQFGELIINEILFNPVSGGSDYIEIYNISDKTLWLKNLYLFNYNFDGNPDNFTLIDTLGKYVLPREYKVFSTNKDWVCNYYKHNDKSAFINLPEMPLMNDDFGHIGISNNMNIVIDEVDYNQSMHFELLTEYEGVSLEKINTKISSAEISNWTSAAATYGFGTPGLENSHVINLEKTSAFLTVLPEMFSPDDDGNNDIVSITLKSENTQGMATVKIFDANGFEIIKLVNNVPVGNTQTWFWDGLNEEGKKCAIGIYIVYAELLYISGKKIIEKKTVTIGGK
ncbi:MAG: lamin tail domain-containing protein [Bacteroidetes bacterium]|nr:lamin tail domain-containing protein [Bacteroidota bacterium]